MSWWGRRIVYLDRNGGIARLLSLPLAMRQLGMDHGSHSWHTAELPKLLEAMLLCSRECLAMVCRSLFDGGSYGQILSHDTILQMPSVRD